MCTQTCERRLRHPPFQGAFAPIYVLNIYIYIYIYREREMQRERERLTIYITYIYIYIQREREMERQREIQIQIQIDIYTYIYIYTCPFLSGADDLFGAASETTEVLRFHQDLSALSEIAPCKIPVQFVRGIYQAGSRLGWLRLPPLNQLELFYLSR